AAAARLLLSRLGAAAPGGVDAGPDAPGEGPAARRHLDILPTLRVRVSCGASAAS
ncbi:LacI family transcriptional regulator, partial [Streptomyces californicus]